MTVRQCFLTVATGLSQVACQATLISSFQFVVEQQGQELDGRELTLDGLSRSEVKRFQHP
jgi:hypothetical protein